MTYKELTYHYFLKDTDTFVPLSDMVKVVSGIYTRAGEIFLLEDFKQIADSSVGYSRCIKDEVNLEPDVIMPIVPRDTDLSFLDDVAYQISKGLIFIEAKNYSRSQQSSLQTFIHMYPRLNSYIKKCELVTDANPDGNIINKINILSKKQSDVLLHPKHILSFTENKSQSFFDTKGQFAIPTGMYGIGSLGDSLTDDVLTAILNSKLFSIIRYNEECKDTDNRHAKYDSVAHFPISRQVVDKSLLLALSSMVKCLTHLKKLTSDSHSLQVARYVRQIMEMLIFELYFSDYMNLKGLSISPALKDSFLTEAALDMTSHSNAIYNWFQSPSNIIRQKIMLLDSRSPELLYPIFMLIK